jgi:hypothetical protein
MQLVKNYAYDECNNSKLLFKKIDSLKKEGKINYTKSDGWHFSIEDLELEDYELEELLNTFDELEVYPYDLDDDDEIFEETYDF